ncbi:MAG: alpha/beta hydrolase [Clostridiales bacterium]|nr:alpha/beta hydrolase [Clostridiales bacterium]
MERLKRSIPLWEDRPEVYLTHCPGSGDSQDLKTVHGKMPAVIVCPGGGYMLTADSEAEPVAFKFAANGYQSFVLRYSTMKTGNSVFPGPLFDLARAMLILHENAHEWNIDTKRIIVCGFSAGGHLAASLGVFWNSEFVSERLVGEGLIKGSGDEPENGMDRKLPDISAIKPAALVLAYPVVDQTRTLKDWKGKSPEGEMIDLRKVCNMAVYGKEDPDIVDQAEISPINYVSSETPPTFIWHTSQDNMVFVEGSFLYGLELRKNKIPFELHIFEEGPHALSLCDETTVKDKEQLNFTCRAWPGLAFRWLERHGL